MERVRNLLRVLLGRALSQHGQEAPALSDILIERASGRFEPRLGAYFANGYCTWAPVRPADCYAFCERYAAWDLTSLRRALLCEAQEIYARMCAEHLAEVGRTRERRGMAAALLDRLRRRTRSARAGADWRARAGARGGGRDPSSRRDAAPAAPMVGPAE